MNKLKNFKGLKIEDEEQGIVSAVFSTFNNIDSDGDVTEPGAFEDGAPVRMSAYNHKSWESELPVGKGTIKTTDEAAIFQGRFFLNTTAGRDTFEVVKEMGKLQEWSYGYDVVESEAGVHDEQDVQILKEIKVHEVSPVILGAGVDTRTLDVKSKSMKFADHIAEVMAAVELVTERAVSIATIRENEGKSLGEQSKELLAELQSKLQGLAKVLTEEPKDDGAPGEVAQAIARDIRSRARL